MACIINHKGLWDPLYGGSGSGLVIVPFLKTQVVDQYHWLGNGEFLDSVGRNVPREAPQAFAQAVVEADAASSNSR